MTRIHFLFAASVFWLAGCGGAPPRRGSVSPANLPTAVSVITPQFEQRPEIYQAAGTVRARASATIAAKWTGYVREVKVQTGDRVRAGQLLVALDARDLDAGASRAEAARDEVRNSIPEADSAVKLAKANLILVQVTFRRMKELYDKKSLSDQEFDEASAKLKTAQAAFSMAEARRTELNARLAQADQEVYQAQVNRSYAEVRAPFAGIVTSKAVDPGNLAMPGEPLLTIERESYRLEVPVEESRLGSIHPGQPVSVRLDGLDRTMDARVSEIVPAVDAATRSYTVKMDLPVVANLRSGIFGRASFPLGQRAILAIPAGAAIERGQLQFVFVAEGGVAKTRLVTLGEKARGRVEVLSGLSAGEKVIYPVPATLTGGMRIEVRP